MATKKDPRDANRRVDFPEAGQGVYLLLRNSGTRTLHSKFKADHVRIVDAAFLTADIEILELLLGLMAWKGDEPAGVTFDDLDNISLQFLVDKLRDAWYLSIHGRNFEEQVAHVEALVKAAEDKANPPPLTTSPGDISEASSEQPTGQD